MIKKITGIKNYLLGDVHGNKRPLINNTPFLKKQNKYLSNQKEGRLDKKKFLEKYRKKIILALMIGVSTTTLMSMIDQDIQIEEKLSGKQEVVVKIKELQEAENQDVVRQLERIRAGLHLHNNGLQDNNVIAREEITEDEIFAWDDDELAGYENNNIDSQFEIKTDSKNPRSIKEVLDYNQEGDIVFNLETVGQVATKHKNEYLKNIAGTKRIIKRRDEYRDSLESVFKMEGTPIEFITIGPVETRFKSATSNKGAKGVFQFLKRTANKYREQVDVDANIDIRNDPVKSGRACAKYLRELYDNYGDWNLALSRYNGALFVDRYVKSAKSNFSYVDFLAKREKRINEIRNKIRNGEAITCKVKRGDSLSLIASRYKMDYLSIKKENNLKSNKVVPGQILRIPILNQEHAKNVFTVEMSSSRQNLDYPAKIAGFNAAEFDLENMQKSIVLAGVK